MDSAPAQSAGLSPLKAALGSDEPELSFSEICGLAMEEFWRAAEAELVDLTKSEWARVLVDIGAKRNYGLAPGVKASRARAVVFWRSLQLRELALAHACALGRETAWRHFVSRFREPLTQAAVGLTGSASLGRELADSLYAEMFGVNEGDRERRSPLSSYEGRGSLMGFLRATLAQRQVDHYRRIHRETPIAGRDFAGGVKAADPSLEVLARLGESLTATMRSLEAEERFLLSAWFLDQRTLLDIGQVLHVHEATVSRKLKRLTSRLHKDLLKNLRAAGMSRRSAEEALGTDPRDVSINLRSLLQSSPAGAFFQREVYPDGGEA